MLRWKISTTEEIWR